METKAKKNTEQVLMQHEWQAPIFFSLYFRARKTFLIYQKRILALNKAFERDCWQRSVTDTAHQMENNKKFNTNI